VVGQNRTCEHRRQQQKKKLAFFLNNFFGTSLATRNEQFFNNATMGDVRQMNLTFYYVINLLTAATLNN